MRDHRRKGIRKKHYLRTMGILMASMMVLAAGTSQLALASEDKAPTETVDEKEEKMIIYLNGKSGKDRHSGESREEAVNTFQRAAELAGDYGVIRICGTVTVKGDQTWSLPAGVSVRRADGFDGALVKVTGSLILDNVRIYAEDITGDGTVEGAVEKEKVSIPKSVTVDEPTVLSKIPLTKCEGDGVFAWEDENFTPSEYETECKVIFHPYNDDAVDYSDERGWDEDEKVVVRKVTVYVASLKPEDTEEEKENEPETTPEATPEPAPENTPEATPEPVPENTPEVTPEPTQEVTPQVTPQSTPEPTPENTPVPDVPKKNDPAPNDTTQNIPAGSDEAADSGMESSGASDSVPAATPEITPGTAPGTEPAVPEVTPGPENTVEPDIPQESLTEEEMAAAEEVENLIDYLPSDVDSREVVEAIVDATRWYESLTQEQRDLFGEDTYKKLTAAQEKAAVYNRQCNGVTIEGDIPWYVQFQVELKNDKSDVSVLQEKNVDTFISPYDMKLWDMMNDEEYRLNGQQVRITVPAPDSNVYTQLVVVHYLEDGSVEYITPIYNNDGTISFVTTSFSPYNVAGSKVLVGNTDKLYSGSVNSSKLTGGSGSNSTAGKSTGSGSSVSKSSGKNSSGNTSTSGSRKTSAKKALSWVPRTGDDQPIILHVVVAAVALIALVIIMFGAKRRKK